MAPVENNELLHKTELEKWKKCSVFGIIVELLQQIF